MRYNVRSFSWWLLASYILCNGVCSYSGYWQDAKNWFRSVLSLRQEIKKMPLLPQRTTSISYGVAENQGARDYMEDRYDIQQKKSFFYAAVFDGHGGSFTAQFLKNNLFNSIVERYMWALAVPRKLKSAFLATNESLAEEQVVFQNCMKAMFPNFKEEKSGSTAVVAFVDGNTDLYLAHVGDSRAIGSNGQALTQDHTGKNEREVVRVGKENIIYAYGAPRLGGNFMVTRAFGDFALEKYGLTAEPEINIYKWDDFDFIVLASDGIWDVMGNQEVADYVRQRLADDNASLDRIAQEIIIEASRKSQLKFAKKNYVSSKELLLFDDKSLYDVHTFPELNKAHDNQTVVIIKNAR